ncbi:S1C family serine protease [Brevibacterium paucivorans]|uniref:S1C family serine protease n=1 Tax=Brevibacterium paucivorans TaxID=170994 RepID=UPI0032190225
MSNNPFGPGSGPDDQSFPRTFPPAEQQPQQPAQPQQPMAPQQSSGYGNNGYQNSFGSAPAPDHTPTAVTPQPGATSTPKERKGPSWGGVIAIATVAALLAGGIGAGATYALQSLQNSTSAQETSTADEKIKTADVPDWATIASDAAKSVVAIQVGRDGKVGELGSGFVYKNKDSDSLFIVTNNHVVASGDSAGGEVKAVFRSGATVAAEIVGRDPETDVAVLKMKDVPRGVDALPVGNSDALKVGEPVMALGNPLGLADTVTTGIVSALNRPVATANPGKSDQPEVATITNAIQTDAAINPGNSGGPLVNGAGKVIGVNSSAAALPGTAESGQAGSIGIGFAIPIAQATWIADQLIDTGQARHAYLGVKIVSGDVSRSGVTVGSAVVDHVENGSPAEQGGLNKGDHIVAFNDTPVNGAVSLQALTRSKKEGDTVKLTVVRGGQPTDLNVTLAAK